jgi:hypothetical protein
MRPKSYPSRGARSRRPDETKSIRAVGGANFTPIRAGRRLLYLRHDLARDAPLILARIDDLEHASRPGAGNRQSGFALVIRDQLSFFYRRARRGGLVRLINRDIYFGAPRRPLRELTIAAKATERGLPTAEPIGALIETLAPAFYRYGILTRTLLGMTLWEFLSTDDDPLVRAHVLTQARQAIECIHGGGLFHADLNLHNLFVTHSGESFKVVILDLDKARLYPDPLPPRLCQDNFRRLLRSARKLDPAGRLLDTAALDILVGARP